MPLLSGTWLGQYYDANEWSGDVILDLIVNLDNTLGGTALLLVKGTDLGYRGNIVGNVSGDTVSLTVTSQGPPFASVTFTGYWEQITATHVYNEQSMFGVVSPSNAPPQFLNDTAGGTWILWPSSPNYAFPERF